MVLPTLTPAEIAYEQLHAWDNRQDWLNAWGTIALLITTFAIVVRLYGRRIRGLSLAWNDYTAIISLVFTFGVCGAIFRAVRYGLGIHVVRVGLHPAMEVAKSLYVMEVLFPFAYVTSRWSILMLYHSIFGFNNRRFVVALYVLGGLWTITAVTAFFSNLLQCIPISLAWTSDHSHHCLDLRQEMLAYDVISVILNFATLFLPLPLIWQLHLSLQRRLAIVIIYALGLLVIVMNAARAGLTSRVDSSHPDFTWLQCWPAMLVILETNLTIICSCIPTWRPICTRISNSIASQARRAGIGDGAITVPFVLLKTRTTLSEKFGSHARRNSSFYLDDEKLLGRSLSGYSKLSPSEKKMVSLRGHLSLPRPKTFQWANANPHWQDEEHGAMNAKGAMSGGHRTHSPPIEPLIVESLKQSGYETAFHRPSSPQSFHDDFLQHDPYARSPFPSTRRSSRKHNIRNLSLDTSDHVVRSSSQDKQRRTPETGATSATLINTPHNSQRSTRKAKQTIFSALDATLSRSSTQKSTGLRKRSTPNGPLLLSSDRYVPPPPLVNRDRKNVTSKTTPPKSPHLPRSKSSTQRGGPHYVKSPLMDSNDRIRIGSPREVLIRPPSRGKSLKRQPQQQQHPPPPQKQGATPQIQRKPVYESSEHRGPGSQQAESSRFEKQTEREPAVHESEDEEPISPIAWDSEAAVSPLKFRKQTPSKKDWDRGRLEHEQKRNLEASQRLNIPGDAPQQRERSNAENNLYDEDEMYDTRDGPAPRTRNHMEDRIAVPERAKVREKKWEKPLPPLPPQDDESERSDGGRLW